MTGLSAGAAMTSVMLATYADLFEAGAIMAGLPVRLRDVADRRVHVHEPGPRQDPPPHGPTSSRRARARLRPASRIWHGDADWVVRPANETQLVRQWTGVAGRLRGARDHGHRRPRRRMKNTRMRRGVVRVESWLIKGMGHGVALSPKDGCGKAGAYLLDESLCSTTKAAAFFGLIAADGTPTPGATSSSGGATSSSSSSGSVAGECD